LLQDLQCLVDGIPNFNFQRTAEQCLQAWAPLRSGDLTHSNGRRQGGTGPGSPHPRSSQTGPPQTSLCTEPRDGLCNARVSQYSRGVHR
jgi:hypothetical protein